jgi:hypothetical protein
MTPGRGHRIRLAQARPLGIKDAAACFPAVTASASTSAAETPASAARNVVRPPIGRGAQTLPRNRPPAALGDA